MTSTEDTVKQRDASRTKRALLEAASELFGRHGYERTTLREIGEQAGVDAALIARYFGNKASIYIACLEADEPARDADHQSNQLRQGLVERVIDRATRFGPTPVLQAIVVPTDDPHVGRAARTVMARRTVGPLRDRIAADGLDRAELRAEIAVAALTGIALARSAGTLAVLGTASTSDVIEITEQLLREVAE
jgi:AcrR family transcriptional regulator